MKNKLLKSIKINLKFLPFIFLFFIFPQIVFSENISSLINLLKTGSQEEKIYAAQSLSSSGESAAVDPLIMALNDPDKMVQSYVMVALKDMGKKTVKALISALKNEKTNIRANAAKVLGDLEDKSAVDPLVETLKDSKKGVRKSVILALSKIADLKSVDPIIGSLSDKDPGTRRAAVNALFVFKDKRSINPLINSLNDPDLLVKEEVIRTLSAFEPDNNIINSLIKVLADPEDRMRNSARDSLITIGEPTVDLLISNLKNENPLIKYGAALSLGKIGNKKSVNPLIDTLKDRDSDVRSAAVIALGNLKDKNSIKDLVILLKDPNENVRAETADALGKIKDPLATDGLLSALKDFDTNVRIAAIRALGEIGDRKAIPFLKDVAANDKMDVVKNAAIRIISTLENK